MEEPVYAVPAFDAHGLPLQPPELGRRRDQLPQRPRRSETSVFAPSPEFTMTTPLADRAATTLPVSKTRARMCLVRQLACPRAATCRSWI